MKNETKKEMGKYFLDISKILFAAAILAPLLKEGEKVSILVIFITLLIAMIAIVLINSGAEK